MQDEIKQLNQILQKNHSETLAVIRETAKNVIGFEEFLDIRGNPYAYPATSTLSASATGSFAVPNNDNYRVLKSFKIYAERPSDLRIFLAGIPIYQQPIEGVEDLTNFFKMFILPPETSFSFTIQNLDGSNTSRTNVNLLFWNINKTSFEGYKSRLITKFNIDAAPNGNIPMR